MAEEEKIPVEPAGTDEQRALWQRLADEKVAMLGTRDADGSISERPVQPVRVEAEGRVWIFTAADGDIARDVARDARVHVAFVNPADELYASLNGEARVLRDPRKARELWSTAAGLWFPGGPDDPNLGLVRIDVHRGDYWDMKDARLVRFFKLAARLRRAPVPTTSRRTSGSRNSRHAPGTTNSTADCRAEQTGASWASATGNGE
jgi:general stress protein 26